MAAARHDAKGYLPLPGHTTHKHNKGKMASETPNHVPIRRGASLRSSLSSPMLGVFYIRIPVKNGILPLHRRTKQRAAQDPPKPPNGCTTSTMVAVPDPPEGKRRHPSAPSRGRYVGRDVRHQRADGEDVYRPILHVFIFLR